MSEEPTDPLLDSTIKELWKLARGDFDLVEEACVACLEQKGSGWFKPMVWQVNIEKATRYIIERRNEIESIAAADELDD